MDYDHKLISANRAIVNDYDFIRFTWADLNGISRGRNVPAKQAQKYLEVGPNVVSLANCLGPRGGIKTPKEISAINYGNGDLVPNLETLHVLPWMGKGKYRIGEVLCDVRWQTDNTIQEASTRNMAVKQLYRLHQLGYRFLSSPEIEFRVLQKGVPVFHGNDMFSHALSAEHEEHQFDMISKLAIAGVSVQTSMVEYGSGQFEFTLEPDFGISALDQQFIFKDGIKEMYRQLEYEADFLSKTLMGETGNGLHMNHSLWTRDGSHNAMWDAKSKDGLSDVARYWIGGLIRHAPALTGLCCPTVSCYRRLHTPWSPDLINWGIDNRMVTIRAKVGGEKGTYVENRIPTGPCNYYLAAAATIAAGIDGIKNKIEPPAEQHNMKADPLPKTLSEALDALEADKVLCNDLGKQAMEWYLLIKRKLDLGKLKDYDPATAEDVEILGQERDYYKLM